MHKHISQNKKAYNAIAGKFSDTREFLWDDLKGLERYAKDGDTVLDIGCGNGRLYQLFQDMQVHYTGIDQSSELIAIAKKRFPDLRFIVSEMTDMAIQSNSADIIYAIASFHHLPTIELRVKALEEMKRLLKPQGKIVMLNWNLMSNWARKKYTSTNGNDFFIPWKDGKGNILETRYYHSFLLEDLHDLAEAAGLEIIEQHYIKKGKVSSIGPGENILTVLTS